MEKLSIYLLVFYNFVFFWKFYKNPYLLCTSELASTFYPQWVWQGKLWKSGLPPFKDKIFYRYPACIPFLSTFYFPSGLLSLNGSFRVYAYSILLHYLLASLIAYKMLGIFGALTLTYCAYNIKPQTPAFVYTMCWMPGMLIPGWFGAFSCFMAITGGYWPILVYFFPLAVFLNPICLLGVIPALVQIIPFMWYWKRSVRSGKKYNKKEGSIPFLKLKDLFIWNDSVSQTRGVHYPEVAMYMGIAVFFIWKVSWWWIPTIISILICAGAYSIQRIPARSLYLLIFCIVVLSTSYVYSIALVCLQGILLVKTNTIYPSFPFSQWWDKPSVLYKKYKDKTKWPHFSGYLDGVRHAEYQGDFRLRAT